MPKIPTRTSTPQTTPQTSTRDYEVELGLLEHMARIFDDPTPEQAEEMKARWQRGIDWQVVLEVVTGLEKHDGLAPTERFRALRQLADNLPIQYSKKTGKRLWNREIMQWWIDWCGLTEFPETEEQERQFQEEMAAMDRLRESSYRERKGAAS